MNNVIQNPPFETKDLPLAATLLFFGYPIINVNRKNPKEVFFTFGHLEGLPLLADAIVTFMNKELRVEPNEYFDAIKDLKVVIYGGKHNRKK